MLGEKSKISAAELLKNSLVSQDFSEAISEFSSNDFVSPFLEFAKLESEEEAKIKAQELLDVIIRISELNTEEASKVIELLFRNRTEFGGNVLHGLIWDARFSPANQLAVIGVLFNSSTFRDRLLNEKDIKDETPIEFFKQFLDKYFDQFAKIGLMALDLGINVQDFLLDAVILKNHDLIAAIYRHQNYEVSDDEQLMYLVHRQKFEELYPAFKTDEALLIFKNHFDKFWHILPEFTQQDTELDAHKRYLTILNWAVENNFTKTVKVLIANGADVNAKDSSGQNILHLIAKSGKAEMAKIMITSVFDINAKDDSGKTPLHLAVISGHIETAKTLIANGADVNAQDEDGNTPLHEAAYEGNSNTATALIEKGANVNAQDYFDQTPLHLAAIKGNRKLVQTLIDLGAEVSALDEDGKTPLHLAAQFSKTKAIKILIASRADVNARAKDFKTPLHLAVISDNNNIVKSLTANSADVNARDEDGKTPLHLAVRFCRTKIVSTLILKGSDVNALDRYGKTPLHFATNYLTIGIAESLIAAGADVNAKDNSGQTLLQIAAGDIRLRLTKLFEAFDTIISIRSLEQKFSQKGLISTSTIHLFGHFMTVMPLGHKFSVDSEMEALIKKILEEYPSIGLNQVQNSRA